MPTQKCPPMRGELDDEPISLLSVLEAQNASLRNLLADLAIRTERLRRQVAEVENRASAGAVELGPHTSPPSRRRRRVI